MPDFRIFPNRINDHSMIKTAISISFLLLGLNLYGQEIPLHQNKFSFQIEKQLAAEKLRKVRAAWEYTYIGRLKEAIDVHDYDVEDRWGFDTLTTEGIQYFHNFQAKDALEEILQRAAKERILIINESHLIPLHRYFTKRLLPGLKKAGFRYFGLEALANCQALPPEANVPCDTSLNKRGYPLNSFFSGTYTREPQMANLLREAHRLGFEIFPYEQYGEKREYYQAKYISEVWQKDPQAKILILCGFGHNIEVVDEETPVHNGKLMAWHLRQMTGIDPLTINQYILSESAEGKETPLYRRINEPRPSVFINEKGRLFSGWPGKDDRFDMLVFHPRTQYIYGRPAWLINDPANELISVDKKEVRLSYPIIVKAYKTDEPDEAVPIDAIEWRNEKDDIRLVLPSGDYRLGLENSKGEKQVIMMQIK